jgi:hypothetical protein
MVYSWVVVSLGAELRRASGETLPGSITDLSYAGAYFELWGEGASLEDTSAILVCPAFADEVKVKIRRRAGDEGQVRGVGVEFLNVTSNVRAGLARCIGLLAG